jgi:hypothetical protein
MALMHRVLAGALAGALCLCALAGCASPPPPVPLSAAQRMERLQQGFDRYWQAIRGEYPDAVRPDVSIVQIQGTGTLAQLLRACLRKEGVVGLSVSLDGTIGVTPAGSAQGPQQLERQAIGLYSCSVQYPPRDLYDSFLSDSQLGALWDYYVGFLEPCLEFSGHGVSTAPGRREFIDGYYAGERWNPYNGISFASSLAGDGDILKRCPANPPWLKSP